MKTEDIFDMLTGIDENLITSAGEDLENYRCSGGKSYSVDEKSVFSWKRASAAIVCAAVMLGAFFVVKNINRTKIPVDDPSSDYSGLGNSSSTESSGSSSSDMSSSSTTPSESGGESSGNTPQTKPMQGYYDSVFKEIAIEPPSVGMPFSYDEVMDRLTDPKYGELDSYYLCEAVELMTLPECEKLLGFEDFFYKLNGVKYDEVKPEGADYFRDNVFYRVKVIENLLSGEKCGYEIYTAIDYKIGNDPVSPSYQRSTDPPYAPGERFTLVLYNKEENSDFTRSGVLDDLRLDVKEIDGVPFAFARQRFCFSALHIDGTEKISETVVASTTGNPVKYDARIKLSDLSDFLRKDWQNRRENPGYSRGIMRLAEEYKNAGVILSDEQLQKLSELYQDVNPAWEKLPYQEGIITGEVDPNAPGLDPETAKKIISEHNDFDDIVAEFEKVQLPDSTSSDSNQTIRLYKIDDLGSEIVIFPMEKQIHYLKIDPDGTEQTEILFEQSYDWEN